MQAAPERRVDRDATCSSPSRAFESEAPNEGERAWSALVVGADADERASLVGSFRRPSYRIFEAASADAAKAVLREQRVDLVVACEGQPGTSGIDLLEEVRRGWPSVRRVLVSTSRDARIASDAVNRAGIEYVLERPLSPAAVDDVRRQLNGAGPDRARKLGVDEAPPQARYGIVGTSRPIRELLSLIERIADTDSTVLITGETGTGKELVGRAVHDASHRSQRVFSAINSAAMPETLLESELFGHCRGSFTGASANRKGLFEHADGGTVFLDELGEMPLSMQAKLLRFLQTGEIRPVGGEQTRRVNVRLVAATNRSLEEEVAGGRFREDLYYRLAVIPLEVPPLRERIEDLPILVDHFLEVLGRKDKPIQEVDPEAMDMLMRHRWPGNVRELQNVIERGVALCAGKRIGLRDLPRRLQSDSALEAAPGIQSLPGLERRHILETLDKVGWNRQKAAGLLQISTTTLWRRLKQFGLEEQRMRNGGGVTF